MIRIVVVDDQPAVRESLAAALSSEPDLAVVGQFASADWVLEGMTRVQSDVVVVDVSVPGFKDTQLCAALRLRHPGLRMLALTSLPSESGMVWAFKAGVKGMVLRDSAPGVLRQAVRTVVRAGSYVDPRMASMLVALARKGGCSKGPQALTLQERRIAELLPGGLTNSQIGKQLGISDQTVKTHMSNLMRKLDARDRTQAAVIAQRESVG